MKMPLMKCGHTAQAIDNATKKPCCVICAGDPNSEVEDVVPDLTGRLAKCNCCDNTRKSSIDLAFFEYRGKGSKCAEEQCHVCGYYTKNNELKNGKVCYVNSDKPIPKVCVNVGKKCVYGEFEYDNYYCGCRGWD